MFTAIVDSSKVFVDYMVKKTLKDHQVARDKVRYSQTLSEALSFDLLGDTELDLISISDTESLSKIVEELESISESPKGILFAVTIPRNRTRKFEKLVKDNGGEIVLAKGKGKETGLDIALNSLPLKKEVKAFIKDYVGEDEDQGISLASRLGEEDLGELSKWGIPEIKRAISDKVGNSQPWHLENAVVNDDQVELCRQLLRIETNDSALPAIGFMMKRFSEMNLILSHKGSKEEISKAIGKNGFAFNMIYNQARRIGRKKTHYAIRLLSELSRSLKSSGNKKLNNSLFKIAFLDLNEVLNDRKPI